MAKITIEVDITQITQITLASLKDDYESAMFHDKNSLDWDKKFNKALRRVLRHYMGESEYKEYIKRIKSNKYNEEF